MKPALLRRLHTDAERKRHNHPHTQFLHWTWITAGGAVVAKGINTKATPPKHYGYTKPDPNFRPTIHAEINALRDLWRRGRPKATLTAINLRLTKTGTMADARPCTRCFDFLKTFGVRTVCYSTPIGWATLKS